MSAPICQSCSRIMILSVKDDAYHCPPCDVEIRKQLKADYKIVCTSKTNLKPRWKSPGTLLQKELWVRMGYLFRKQNG